MSNKRAYSRTTATKRYVPLCAGDRVFVQNAGPGTQDLIGEVGVVDGLTEDGNPYVTVRNPFSHEEDTVCFARRCVRKLRA